MAHHRVSFPLQAPGELAGDVLHELESHLDAQVGLGADGIVTLSVEADSAEHARERILEAMHAVHGEGYFDLTELREPMAISVRRYQIGAGSTADLASRVGQGFARTLSEAPGFIAYHLLNAGDDVIVSIKVFANADDLAQSDELTASWERENLGAFRLRPLESNEGDVLVSRRAR